MGFTLPLFLDAARRKYPPNEGGKHKEREVACRFHAAPRFSMLRGGNTPQMRGVNTKKGRRRVGFTPPPVYRCCWEEIPPMIGG